jgi:hypothetical protein
MAELKPYVGRRLKKAADAALLAKLGFVDLLVSQPPRPLPETDDPADIKQFSNDAMWSSLTLDGVKLIFTVEDLTRIVRDACNGSKLKVRSLHIVSHGNSGQCRIGLVQVMRSELEDAGNAKRKELAKLKEFLVPGISMVHIHACRTADTEEFLRHLSKLWGNVSVRSFTDYQSQDDNDGDIIETGPVVTCTGEYCEKIDLPSFW